MISPGLGLCASLACHIHENPATYMKTLSGDTVMVNVAWHNFPCLLVDESLIHMLGAP